MNEFIHTFSFVTYITEAQRKRMKDTYGKKLFPNHDKSKWIFSGYAENGLRAEIIHTPIIEKLKRRIYKDYKATWIVTPAKLIYPGQPMKKLYTSEEYAQSCDLLYKIIEEIKADSGVDLLHKAKLYRVDLTKDIETPSEEYTQEVIRMAKIALKKYGYELLNLNDIDEKKEEWKDENAVFFQNQSQEIQAKAYNKFEDMKIHGYDTVGHAGLLRFELALKRAFMKDKGFICEKHITDENLADILNSILTHAPELMQKHIADPLWSGAMVSKEMQKRMIRKYCGYKTDSVKYKKMIAYRKTCNRVKSMKRVDENPTVERYFRDMGLSPLCCSDEVGQIPSFADLLNQIPVLGSGCNMKPEAMDLN